MTKSPLSGGATKSVTKINLSQDAEGTLQLITTRKAITRMAGTQAAKKVNKIASSRTFLLLSIRAVDVHSPCRQASIYARQQCTMDIINSWMRCVMAYGA